MPGQTTGARPQRIWPSFAYVSVGRVATMFETATCRCACKRSRVDHPEPAAACCRLP
jgi:hypothetical protein